MEKTNLKINGKDLELPIVTGTENEGALDISKLRGETGYVTIDYGLKNTAVTKSKITFLNGEEGILRYRGYPIEQLAEKASFLEVSYLLIYGELPTKQELEKFTKGVTNHTLIHEDMKKFFEGYPQRAHPMGVLASMTGALSSFYPDSLDPDLGEDDVNLTIQRLIAKTATIAAWSYKNSVGHPVMYPQNRLDYSANLLYMMFAKPTEDYEINDKVVSALNKLLILHADHEQNCSTTAVRVVGSSHANLYAAASAGIMALWGPLHGGANQAVIEMLQNIYNDGGASKENIEKWIKRFKDKTTNQRLMGFGHRVYKNFDPRATIIKKAADEVLDDLNVDDPLLDVAKQLEQAALNDDYFKEKKLYPNVDYYSGLLYRAMGIPTDMFTVMFALGRMPGWIANWKEMLEDKHPITRPRQIYSGENKRDYVPLDKR
ncbi:citrate synthase [Rhodohalobacter sp.]|uniref:citrate synthase n=1 Tax=Rhodohalobacter sp. TaxID=1974210 RepID=UPI002ACD5449|nr:citrate synthase [Rhodohalobacter sp.]MDZ7756842.1 citrate synthase [Rhodohalobacter sp.]